MAGKAMAIIDQKKLYSIKLDALRIQGIVNAPAHKSSLVRFAASFRHFQKSTREMLKIRLRAMKQGIEPKPDNLKILVHVRGGIGDVVMSRIFVSKLRQAFPDAEIDFCHDSEKIVRMVFPEHAEGILINHFQDRKYVPENYDLVMSGCHFFMFDHYDLPRIKKYVPDYIPAFEQALEIQKCFQAFAEYSPLFDGQFSEIMVRHGYTRISALGLFSGIDVCQEDKCCLPISAERKKDILKKFGLKNKKFITLHNGMNTNTKIAGAMTRNWPENSWREFAKLFKKEYPDISIVQIGGSTSASFDFADISLVNLTSLDELPYILNAALFHLDGETGMAHLANIADVKAIVLYGPSRAAYLAYPRNINIPAENCGGCMNIDNYWMSKCILGFSKERQCLGTIKPNTVFNAAQAYLTKINIKY